MKYNVLTLTILISVMVFFTGVLSIANAQDLHVKMSASKEVVGPGDHTTYVLAVSNTGSTDLLNVSVSIELPDLINGFNTPADFDCGYNGCAPNETIYWNIGTLAPGESRTTFYRVQIVNNATETTIISKTTASASNSTDSQSSLKIAIDPTPLLRLILTSTSGPVAPGKPVTYKLSYGNIGSTSPSNVVIKMPIPDGTSFTSATHNGTIKNDTVIWNIGQLGSGGGGEVRMVAAVNNNMGNGQLIKATATIHPNVNNEYIVSSSNIIPIHSIIPLKVEYGISQSTVGPQGQVTYTMTATNSGSEDLLDLSARILLPGGIDGFSTPADFDCGYNGCAPNETIYWNIGTLAPGESRTTFFRTYLNKADQPGEVLHSSLTASGSNSEQVIAMQDIFVDPTPLMQLSLAPDSGPAVPGKPFSYTLTVGNVGSNSPSDVTLRIPVPDGTDFVSASDGGRLSNGVVNWDFGLFGVGVSKSVRITVMPDANLTDGSLILAEAQVDPGINTEYIVNSTAVTPVHTPYPLHVEYGISQSSIGPERPVTYTITATNSSSVDLLDLSARILLPGGIDGFSTPAEFDCGYNGCAPNETIYLNIGTLAPGQSKTVLFHTYVSKNDGGGHILRSLFTATGSNVGQVINYQDISVDPTPFLRLNLASGTSPASQGKRFVYTATFGNIGSRASSDAMLRLWVPDGAVFDSVSHGGIEKNGIVTWTMKSLGVGSGGRAKLWVKPNNKLKDGSILLARAELDPNINTEEVLHSKNVTSIMEGGPLTINYTVNKSQVTPDNSITYTIKATNNGSTDLLDLSARILLPGGIHGFSTPTDFDCGYNGCAPNETVIWNIGTLTPGDSQSTSFTTNVNTNAELGNIMQSVVLVSASNSSVNQQLASQDVLIGSLIAFNLPPSAAVIASPKDSTSLVIGGADGSNSLPPDTPFIVKWMHSTDPENDAVTYHWQLSASDDFSSPLIDAASDNGGKDTLYQTTYGDISKILSDDGVVVGDSIMLYDRVVTSDGVNVSMSDTLHITLTRGTLTGIEEQPGGIPTVLALHNNYPNPFNPTTTIRYDLPKAGVVRITVFDVLGRQVSELINTQQSAGYHTITFNASGLSSGVYFYRLKANSHTLIKKMLLMK